MIELSTFRAIVTGVYRMRHALSVTMKKSFQLAKAPQLIRTAHYFKDVLHYFSKNNQKIKMFECQFEGA